MCPHANKTDEIQISSDGVKECRSTSVSLDVYSSRMKNCRTVYPHRIVRPLGKYKGVNNKEQLTSFINDILYHGKKIYNFSGDNPKRSEARDALSHSANYPCEYCFSKGVHISLDNISENEKKLDLALELQWINEKLNSSVDENEKAILQNLKSNLEKKEKELSRKKKTKITWPPSTANGEPRTKAKVLDIVNNLDDLTPDQRKGITGRSLFLDIPSFDFVHGITAEYLHSVCLGMTRRLLELTFSVGQLRLRKTKRKLTKPSVFNKLMSLIKTVREFSRRARDLDFSVMKAAELRNITLFYVPLILDCIEEGEGERKLWLYLSFMIRSCIVPEDEFIHVDKDNIRYCCTEFYKLYHELFDSVNCSYYTHVVCSHLEDIRAAGPFTSTSAFVFESFYGEMRHAFVPGTVSPLKQIMKKIMLKRILSPHCCQTPIYYSPKTTSLENNSIVYSWQNNEHHIYSILEIIDKDHFLCFKVEKNPVQFNDTPTLNWTQIGVYGKGETSNEPIVVKKSDVRGKVIEVMDYLYTCPNEVLREK